MKYTNEKWKLINDGQEINYVSDHGRVATKKYGDDLVMLTQTGSVNKTGRIYYDVTLPKVKGRGIVVRVSRIMAKTFLDDTLPLRFKDNPSDRRVVDHEDNVSTNNHISNIRILTHKQNINAAMDMGIQVGKKPLRVQCVETGEIYESAREAAEVLNLTAASVANVLNPNQPAKTAGGYTFIKL